MFQLVTLAVSVRCSSCSEGAGRRQGRVGAQRTETRSDSNYRGRVDDSEEIVHPRGRTILNCRDRAAAITNLGRVHAYTRLADSRQYPVLGTRPQCATDDDANFVIGP